MCLNFDVTLLTECLFWDVVVEGDVGNSETRVEKSESVKVVGLDKRQEKTRSPRESGRVLSLRVKCLSMYREREKGEGPEMSRR